MKKLVVLAVSMLLIANLASACKAAPSPVPSAGGTAAPQGTADPQGKADRLGRFSTVDLSGNAYDYTMFYGNKLTMVNVWMTWCGYCVEEMPDLAKLSQEYAGHGFAVVGILGDSVKSFTDNPERDDATAKLGLQIMQQTGVQYPVLQPDGVLCKALNTIDGYPTTYFIDNKGEIVDKVVGAGNYNGWKNKIDALLAKAE